MASSRTASKLDRLHSRAFVEELFDERSACASRALAGERGHRPPRGADTEQVIGAVLWVLLQNQARISTVSKPRPRVG